MSRQTRDDVHTMDKKTLINLLIEKDKQIEELERLVEDQKRLRLEDSNQVEEKAVKIKEWVTNKLKELENQNKQLRDQNKKHKETVESLTIKLASLSPSRKKNTTLESVQFIDQTQSPINTIDVNKSLQTRRPQLKKSLQNISNTLPRDINISPRHASSNGQTQNTPQSLQHNSTDLQSLTKIKSDRETGVSLVPISQPHPRQDSPLYDSVNFEFTTGHTTTDLSSIVPCNGSGAQRSTRVAELEEPCPPPPPLHHYDKWEQQIYSLAEETIEAIVKDNSLDSEFANAPNHELASWRKSSSVKDNIISILKPQFTTIDGDQVIEDEDLLVGSKSESTNRFGSAEKRLSNDHASQSSTTNRSGYLDVSLENNRRKLPVQDIFDSPMRSRSGKDSILRTQSVRKNPSPEKLYEFITSDLIKRGYLVKIGALRSYTRWFVLKNFQLFSYKRESDETSKCEPTMILKLEPDVRIQLVSHNSETNFQFKLVYGDKTMILGVESAQKRDDWIRILSIASSMGDIEPSKLTKQNSTQEGMMSLTRHGHMKKCYGTLIGEILFILKSPVDPTPVSYLSMKSARIREITDNVDYDFEEQEMHKQMASFAQDCSLAIYPRYSLNLDPVYLTLCSQQDTDAWFFSLSQASGIDQSQGTQYERTLIQIMVNNSITGGKKSSNLPEYTSCCLWRERPMMLYTDRPINEPLTAMPNETLKGEAIKLFKSISLFTQAPIEPVAIDYHVSLLQNCLGHFLVHPELRNEFFAQLIKQSTYFIHRSQSDKLSSSSSGCSLTHQRSSYDSIAASLSECRLVTDAQTLEYIACEKNAKLELDLATSQSNNIKDRRETVSDEIQAPSPTELIQVMQMIAVAVSLNVPKGRMRTWLINHVKQFASPDTDIGKYAIYTLHSIERTTKNGARDNVPSRTEIMSILLRNPYDHSTPHSLPVSFADGSYLVVGADGSTTVEEFMENMSKNIDIRHSQHSDFYLFSDDPSGSKELHILEPHRKVLDAIGWWEKTYRQHNSGRYKSTKVIKLTCRKRLPLRLEMNETDQERLLIVHQLNQDIVANKIPLKTDLAIELASILAQLTFGDFSRTSENNVLEKILDKVVCNYIPNQLTCSDKQDKPTLTHDVMKRWQSLAGRDPQDCIRVYLNCVRRLKVD